MKNTIVSNVENSITSKDSDYELSLRRTDFVDNKEKFRFIKKIEAAIRASVEYRDFLDYIYDVLGVYKCQVTNELRQHLSLECHHHPTTLYDLVNGVVSKKIEQNEEFCSFDISLEVMKLHYNLQAPFTVLCKSIHEKYHSGALKIPMELVHGTPDFFIREYGAYIEPGDLQSIYEKMEVNFNNCGWKQDEYEWINVEKENHEEES